MSKLRMCGCLIIVIGLSSGYVFAQHDHGNHANHEDVSGPLLSIPVEGLKGDCCDDAVNDALGSIDGVKTVNISKKGRSKHAEITLEEDATIKLSIMRSKLDEASTEMSKNMKVSYKLKEDAIPAIVVHCLQVKATEKDQKKLLDSIKAITGIKDAEAKVAKDLLNVTMQVEDEKVTLGALNKTIQKAGFTLSDVVLGASVAEEANKICPVSKKKVDSKFFVEHKGKKIYVCCKKCLMRVKANPEEWYNKVYGEGHGDHDHCK